MDKELASRIYKEFPSSSVKKAQPNRTIVSQTF